MKPDKQLREVKAWLSRGFWLRQEKEQITRSRQELFDRMTSITQNTEAVAVSGTKDPHKYDELAALDDELAEKEQELARASREIFSAIRAVPDSRYRVLLMARYYECLSWQEIATLTHYQERQVYRLHGAALAAIEPIISAKKSGGPS